MSKINLKIKDDNLNIFTLLNIMNSVKAKMSYDINNKKISFIGNTNIENAIELISKQHKIEEIEIDNRNLTESDEIISKSSNNSEQLISTDSTSFYLNNLRDLCYSFLEKGIPVDIINRHILTCYTELYLSYSTTKQNCFKIADIVKCNYGQNLPNEINGGYVYAIIIDIDIQEELVFLVPIVKQAKYPDSKNVLTLLPEQVSIDCEFTTSFILLNKSKYVSLRRISNKIGTVSSSVFNEIVEQLPEAFFFAPILEDSKVKHNFNGITMNSKAESSEPNNTVEQIKSTKEEPISQTDWLKQTFKNQFDSIPSENSYELELVHFFSKLGLPANSYLKYAFLVSENLEKIKSNDVLDAIIKTYHLKVSPHILLRNLNNEYKDWISKNYPEFFTIFKKPSIFELIKLYKNIYNNKVES